MDNLCPKNLERFVDLDKCIKLIDDINIKISDGNSEEDINRDRSEAEKLVESFRKIIDIYQEQPELLEPCLAELILRLTSSLKELDSKRSTRYHVIFKFLYQLIKVSGFKSISKKFPHEADKLPRLMELLKGEDPKDRINWQTRFVLTVWLSILILTPFDLIKYDISSAGQSIADNIYSILIRGLSLHDSCQHATAFCLAKYFSRPDVIKSDLHLSEFTKTVLEELSNIKLGSASSLDDVKLIGYLRTLCYMFKLLPRADMKRLCPDILNTLIKLDVDQINRELVNHLIIKLIQRAGLALLPRRIASWRCKRGSRILGQVVSDVGGSADNSSKPSIEQLAADEDQNVNTSEEATAAEYIESVLSVLFVAAQNSQTKIRWSAAKGIARLSSRLSRERASDVIDMALANFFNTTSSEFAWHGGSLTLAEMARHGLILEEKLETVIGIISNAIVYDKIKGSFAVGAHVREGACYVIWAMARTYEDHLLAPHISSISVNLLCTMLFDRELQCRRAASATFQELVGRQGTFSEEGIDLLTKVDYQNVGQRQNTYLHLALQVASYGPKYAEPFVTHLMNKKLGHWDIQIRRLACDSLSALMLHLSQDFIATQVIPQLIQQSNQNLDINSKHGAILGLAKVIRGLVPLQYSFTQELIDFVGNIVKLCEKQLKSKQQAPNFIEAIGCIIQSAENASFQFDDDSETLKQWELITLSALDSDNANLRDTGSAALTTLYRTYYSSNKTKQDRLLTVMNKSLASSNESTRCGALRALEKLGAVLRSSAADAVVAMIAKANISTDQSDDKCTNQPMVASTIRTDADTPDIILTSLTAYIAKETREKEQDVIFAQAKAEACDALANFCRALDKSQLILSVKYLSAAFDALIAKTEDYTFDKRGDIGVVVRRAAIKALSDLVLHLLAIDFTSWLFDKEERRIEVLMSRMLQQAVSYHNSARDLAASSFYKLVAAISQLDESQVPHTREILELFNKHDVSDEFNWRDDSTPIFVGLLAKNEYSVDLWTGLIPSVGQVSGLCAKQFRDALSNYLQSLNEPSKEEERNFVLNSYLTTLSRNDRLLTSGLIVADYMLTRGLLNESSPEFQEHLAKFLWRSRGQGDPKRLVSVSSVMSSMLQFTGKVQRDCLRYCLTLLVSGYSKVRAHTAEQLYLSIMTYQSDLEDNLLAASSLQENGEQQSKAIKDCDDDNAQPSKTTAKEVEGDERGEGAKGEDLNLNEAMDLLSQTNWSEPLDKVRPIRDQICSCLMIKM